MDPFLRPGWGEGIVRIARACRPRTSPLPLRGRIPRGPRSCLPYWPSSVHLCTVFEPPKDSFRVAPEFQPLIRRIGLNVEGVFRDPRIIVWRSLEDRENCTLDANGAGGDPVRLHIKRYHPARGFSTPA